MRRWWCAVLALCAVACAEDLAPELPAFSPVEAKTWARVEHPRKHRPQGRRLLLDAEGGARLDGVSLTWERFDTLTRARGGPIPLELLADPRLPFAALEPFLPTGPRFALVVLVGGARPAALDGLDPRARPELIAPLYPIGPGPHIPAGAGDIELAVAAPVPLGRVWREVERVAGCSAEGCVRRVWLSPLRPAQIKEMRGAPGGLLSRAPAPPALPPEEAARVAAKSCAAPENVSIALAPCAPPLGLALVPRTGRAEDLRGARVCYRVWLDCEGRGRVVFVDGDTGTPRWVADIGP